MQKVTARIFSPEKDNIKERLVGIGLGIAGEGDTKPNIILYLKPEMIPEEFRELVNVTYEKIPTITEQIPPPYPFDHPVPMAYIDYETLNSHLRPIIETLRYGNRKGKTRTTKDHIMFIENDPETIDQAEQVLNNYHLIVTPDHQSAIDYLDEVVRTDDQPDLIIIRKKNYPQEGWSVWHYLNQNNCCNSIKHLELQDDEQINSTEVVEGIERILSNTKASPFAFRVSRPSY